MEDGKKVEEKGQGKDKEEEKKEGQVAARESQMAPNVSEEEEEQDQDMVEEQKQVEEVKLEPEEPDWRGGKEASDSEPQRTNRVWVRRKVHRQIRVRRNQGDDGK